VTLEEHVTGPIKALLWDASAFLRRILGDGTGVQKAVELADRLTGFHFITEYTKSECLVVIKRKWMGGEITVDQYLELAMKIHDDCRNMNMCDVKLDDYPCMRQASEIVRKFKIDIIDAAAIVGISNGLLSDFGGDSGPYLVTADDDLAEAARSQDFKVINLNKEA
jgi:predicted nucleic acid-binding protein